MTRRSTRTCRPESEGVIASFTDLAIHAPRFPVTRDPIIACTAETGSRRRQRTAIYCHNHPSRKSCDKTNFDEIQFDNEWLISFDFDKQASKDTNRSRASGESSSSGSSHDRRSLQRFQRRGESKNESTHRDRTTLLDRQDQLTSKCTKYQITF